MIREIVILLLVVVTIGHAFFMAKEGYARKVHDAPHKRFNNYKVPQKGYDNFFGKNQYAYPSYGLRLRQAQDMSLVRDKRINGTSGICASRTHPGILYTVNDHGDGPIVYALDSKTGRVVSMITVKGAINADWEDLACGPCPGYGKDCIYIGDIGNDGGNNALYSNTIYRVREPTKLRYKIVVTVDDTLRYCWKEFDAETLMVDPSANIYLISKTRAPKGVSKIAKISRKAWKNKKLITLTDLADLTSWINGAFLTSGDISKNGKEIFLLTFDKLFHFSVTGGKSIVNTLSHTNPVQVPYKIEPKPQAVCFDAKGEGYFTLGEGLRQTLYSYTRRNFY